MAEKIPTGRTKAPTDGGRGPTEPSDIGDDQQAGAHRGQNFQPRNAGAVEDSIDEAAARTARELNARAGAAEHPGTHQDTAWEARVERGEEWEEQKDPERTSEADDAFEEPVRQALRATRDEP